MRRIRGCGDKASNLPVVLSCCITSVLALLPVAVVTATAIGTVLVLVVLLVVVPVLAIALALLRLLLPLLLLLLLVVGSGSGGDGGRGSHLWLVPLITAPLVGAAGVPVVGGGTSAAVVRGITRVGAVAVISGALALVADS